MPSVSIFPVSLTLVLLHWNKRLVYYQCFYYPWILGSRQLCIFHKQGYEMLKGHFEENNVSHTKYYDWPACNQTVWNAYILITPVFWHHMSTDIHTCAKWNHGLPDSVPLWTDSFHSLMLKLFLFARQKLWVSAVEPRIWQMKHDLWTIGYFGENVWF